MIEKHTTFTVSIVRRYAAQWNIFYDKGQHLSSISMLLIAQYSRLISLSSLLGGSSGKHYHRVIEKHSTFTGSGVSRYVAHLLPHYKVIVMTNIITGL